MEYVKLYITMLLKTDPSPEKLALVPRTIFLPSPVGRGVLFDNLSDRDLKTLFDFLPEDRDFLTRFTVWVSIWIDPSPVSVRVPSLKFVTPSKRFWVNPPLEISDFGPPASGGHNVL